MASATEESTALTLPSEDKIERLQLTLIPSPGTTVSIPDSNLLMTNDDVIQFIRGIMELAIQNQEILDQMRKIGVSDPEKTLNDLIIKMTNDITNNVVYDIDITTNNKLASDGSMVGGSKYKCLAIVYYLVFTFILCLFLGIGFSDVFNIRTNTVWLYGQMLEYIGWIWMYLYSSTRLGLSQQRDLYIAYLMTTICSALGLATIYNLPSWMASIIISGMGLVDAMCSNWPLLIDPANKKAVDEAERKAQVLDIISKTQVPVIINSETQMLTQNQIVLALFSGYFGQTPVSTGENFNKFVQGLSMVNSAILTAISNIKDASYADFGKLLVTELKKLQSKLIRDTMDSTLGLESSENAAKLREVRRMIGDMPSATSTATTATVATSPRLRGNTSPAPRGSTSQAPRAAWNYDSNFGGRRRSKRRMQKSKRGTKHGGRSRMRKMRTKKRRMSRRKYRR